MVDMEAVEEFRAHALNPEHPCREVQLRTRISSSRQERLVTHTMMLLPAVVEKYMDKVNEKIGTNYKLFNYYGAPDADTLS